MKFVLYAHSIVSDWNNGNAHFLRGVLRELGKRGHETVVLEPADGWSRINLVTDQGHAPLNQFVATFPGLRINLYDDGYDHSGALNEADVVIVHEWNTPEIIAKVGQVRRAGARFTLLFHDTHHRGVSDPYAVRDLPLSDYDAVLAFGETLRLQYEKFGWSRRAFTWHEAADTHLFHPQISDVPLDDVVWIGNWGDGERTQELLDFLLTPARMLRLSGTVYGVRYPDTALFHLSQTQLRYAGWIANTDAPQAFARHRMTVHVPRRPYVETLRGIPTIRVFEALACGIPLVSAPWYDDEGLFRAGTDYLVARDTCEMVEHLNTLRNDPHLAQTIAASGLRQIQCHHTCAHRVDELLAILHKIGSCSQTSN